MSTPKPRIRPKAGPPCQQSEIPLHDPSLDPGSDRPVFEEQHEREPRAAERVVFHEDDCLR